LGAEITKGLGAGANPEIGRKAALDEYEKLSEILEGADMVFVTAGMGGGTGTGAAPVIAKLARELGALTVGVVTKPFLFEGKKRFKQAEQGILVLEENVDSLITIPNQRLLYLAGESLSLVDTFKKADDVLLNAVQGISDLINTTGHINADFADVKTVMENKGLALMGTGVCTGTDRAIKAATEAISSPLLEDISIDGATGIIINITGNDTLSMHETNEAVTLIMEAADDDAEIIFGSVIDDSMEENIKVTVIATGLGGQEKVSTRSTEHIKNTNLTPQREEQVMMARPSTPEAIETVTEAAPIATPTPRIEPAAPVIQPQAEVRVETPVAAAPIETKSTEAEGSSLLESIRNAASKYDSKKESLLQSEEAEMNRPAGATAAEPRRSMNASNRAKSIAERLGFISFEEDEFDSPSFLRRDEQSQRRSTSETPEKPNNRPSL
jgi:cell division protein FtsZ